MKLPPISTTSLSRNNLWELVPRSYKRSGGFTLIEILISLAVITIVASLSLVGWQTYTHYLTTSDLNNIESSIRAARSNAIYGLPNPSYNNIVFDSEGNTTATTVSITINNSTRTFYISAVGGILPFKP